MKKLNLPPLQVIIHLGAWLPLALIVFDYFSGRLSVNPIQDMEQRTGRLAILWLVMSLACTPLASIFGWKELVKRRRAVGLYAFMFAAIHMLLFVGLDYGLNFKLILDAIVEKRFILLGALSLLGLSLLAVTSFKGMMKKMGKNWKRLHRIIYLIAPLVVLHYAQAKKGDLFRLQGDIVRPLVYGVIVLLLLALRLPPVKKKLSAGWAAVRKVGSR